MGTVASILYRCVSFVEWLFRRPIVSTVVWSNYSRMHAGCSARVNHIRPYRVRTTACRSRSQWTPLVPELLCSVD